VAAARAAASTQRVRGHAAQARISPAEGLHQLGSARALCAGDIAEPAPRASESYGAAADTQKASSSKRARLLPQPSSAHMQEQHSAHSPEVATHQNSCVNQGAAEVDRPADGVAAAAAAQESSCEANARAHARSTGAVLTGVRLHFPASAAAADGAGTARHPTIRNRLMRGLASTTSHECVPVPLAQSQPARRVTRWALRAAHLSKVRQANSVGMIELSSDEEKQPVVQGRICYASQP
jgi:hypothetical protein